ncbi:hypothetical protein B0A52_01956 [Exophiala mesophila]|uniref:Uncharacterized protein n=1 Tax=Exophiala mesophila TaxID=212818 RepID=A0A438NEK3_EXOME|nr:hypothetical protein B0A52_01956 [Exophiala mesophila]
MPHKHKRKRDQDDSDFNLPPTSRARTLTVHQKSASIFSDDAARKEKFANKKRRKHGKGGAQADDTPKAFARLMAMQQGRKIKSGLDDGTSDSKANKKKRLDKSAAKFNQDKHNGQSEPEAAQVEDNDDDEQQADVDTMSKQEATSNAPISQPLTILPSERLSDFALRVDQSLPLSSITKRNTAGTKIPGVNIKTPQTKHNKRLGRMISEWRATDARLKDKREDEEADMAEQREEDSLLWLGVDASGAGGKSAKGKKMRRRELEDQADPWKSLVRKRAQEERQRRIQEANGDAGDKNTKTTTTGSIIGRNARGRGLNARDAVQAPPVLKPLKNIFKLKNPVTDTAVVERSIVT